MEPTTSQPKFVRWALMLGIVIILNVFFTVIVALAYPEPDYNNYCPVQPAVTPVDATTCDAQGGIWNATAVPASTAAGVVKPATPVGYCDMYAKCQKPYQAAVDQHALYAFVIPYVWVMPLAQQPVGGSAVVTRDVRRIPTGAVDPTVKNLQWGDFTRGIFEALDRGANWPFLPDGNGNLTEGIGYNIVMVKDRTVMTPARGVLEGVTRKTVMEIATAQGLGVHLGDVPLGGLYDADEIFMCTTAGGIMPITTLDGEPVGGGQVGPVTSAIWDRYWALHADPVLTLAVNYD